MNGEEMKLEEAYHPQPSNAQDLKTLKPKSRPVRGSRQLMMNVQAAARSTIHEYLNLSPAPQQGYAEQRDLALGFGFRVYGKYVSFSTQLRRRKGPLKYIGISKGLWGTLSGIIES